MSQAFRFLELHIHGMRIDDHDHHIFKYVNFGEGEMQGGK